MRMARAWIGCLGVWLLMVVAAVAATAEEAEFSRANQLCEQGQHTAAIEIYEKWLKEGKVSAALYYNLGTAYYRAGQAGKAIEALRRAECLAPRDPDIRANLAAIRRAVSGKEDAGPGGVELLLGRLTLNEWCLTATVCLWAWLGVLTLMQWRPGWRASLRGWSWGLFVLWLGAAACFGGAYFFQKIRRMAIVVQKEVGARQAPYDVSKVVWSLVDGAEAHVIGENKDWLEIRDERGRAGWVKRDQVLIWPS